MLAHGVDSRGRLIVSWVNVEAEKILSGERQADRRSERVVQEKKHRVVVDIYSALRAEGE
jgi:hypothetical protein